MDQPAVAIVGCGRMGRERARCLLRAGARIAHVVDERIELARALAADIPGARCAPSLVDADVAGLDAIFVCTPPGERRAFVATAARNRVALFMEKPLATSLEDAAWMCDVTERAGILTAVGYMNRYRHGVSRARELANNATLLGLTAHWVCGEYAVPWWKERTESGGPINEQATHLVDLCRYIGGDVADVQATCGNDQKTAGAILSFSSGALAALFYSCCAPRKSIGLEVFTDQGSLRLDGWDFRAIDAAEIVGDDPFLLEVESFVRALRTENQRDIRCNIAEAYETQELMDRLLSSASRFAYNGAPTV